MTEELEQALNAVGALAEVTKFAYDSFRQVGFGPNEALKLASDFMTATMAGNKIGNG